jgi:extensin-like protein
VVEVQQISAYSCRGMNGNPRANVSEHAFGNALDIASFTLADGRRVTVRDGWRGAPEEQGFLRDVQASACERFTTVLAPGSNVFHYDHMHVDLMRRSGGHRACNPRAVSGEEVAARARAHYARQGRDPSATGSVDRKTPTKRLPPTAFAPENGGHQLPRAVPGEDGQD